MPVEARDKSGTILLDSCSSVSSHVYTGTRWLTRPATSHTGLTTEPCGGKAKGATVATYLANTDIEISFDLTVQHSPTTAAYISFDNFATRTKLAMMRTPESGDDEY